MMATNEPGIFLLKRGVRAMTMTLATPTMALHRSMVERCCAYTTHFSMKSEGTWAMLSPKRSLICVVKMVTAIPLVKPTTMG